MKITVDLELCQGHGQCEDAAPEVFRVSDDGFAELLVPDVTDAGLETKVRDAASRCPTDAIRLSA